MSPRTNYSGRRFGLLVAMRYAGDSKWLCRCDCGKEVSVLTSNLRTGNSKSCGCRVGSVSRDKALRHGLSDTPVHRSWMSMRQRCLNQKDRAFKNYGGRGIRICERWSVFENFLEDMGEKPVGYELERIDVNGNYEPSNCRWASIKEQARNKRNSHLITFRGETHCFMEWCEIIGVSKGCLEKRLSLGWSLEDALTKPARQTRRANSLVAKGVLEEIDGGKTISGRSAKLLRVPVKGQGELFS